MHSRLPSGVSHFIARAEAPRRAMRAMISNMNKGIFKSS